MYNPANFNAFNLSSSGALGTPLMRSLIKLSLFHCFFSSVRKHRGGGGLSRRKRRKIMNRRRRWFTDNIIMHHKRIHDKNRRLVVASARENVLARKKPGKKPKPSAQAQRVWRDHVEITDKGKIIRGRIDARRLRAKSRWLSVMG